MSDYIRPERQRFNRLDTRLRRRRRGRYALGGLVVAVLLFGYIGPIKSAIKSRAAAHRAAAQKVVKPLFKPVPFATVGGTPLTLVLPAPRNEIITIGYHQAYNTRALSLVPVMNSMGQATTQTVMAAVRSGGRPIFVMAARGRGSALDSSVDIALKAGSVVKSPVTGRVLAVMPYLLYGRINDVRIDIIADGYPGFTIALAHVDKQTVVAGQKVEAGVTPLANVRTLGIASQIDQYLGEAVTHVHIQANQIEAKPIATRAD